MRTTRAAVSCSAMAKQGRSLGRDESKNGSRVGGERPRPSSELQWRRRRSTRAERERERAIDEKLAGANGSGDGGGRGRAHLVANQGASRLPHARHEAAELCRLATAARRGCPRAWMRCGRGEGGERGQAGPASASGPKVRSRPASAPLSFFFFLNFFSPIFF